MRTRALILLLAVLSFASPEARQTTPAPQSDAIAPRPSFAEPGISPDGREIAFESGGDLWTVPAGGGQARLLVSHEATESRPLYSPDGTRLAFVSTRTGNGDIYVLTLESGNLARLTWDDGPDVLDAWSADGRWVYFSSSSLDIAAMNDVFRVSVEGGTPMPVTADRYVNEFFAAPAPDGETVAFSARGIAFAQWWRHGHSHIDQSEIWVRSTGSEARYEMLVGRGAKALWPMWAPDGRTLYFVSDRDGVENLWVRPPSGEPRRLTDFTSGRVLWPSITRDGTTIAIERDLGLWTVDTASGRATSVPVSRRGLPLGPDPAYRRATDDFHELALSPDGKKVAFIARGDVFAASAADGGDAVRVTSTPAIESQVTWAADSRRLAYISYRDGEPQLFLYDFGSQHETRLTSGPARNEEPRFSPDGAKLAFVRNLRELRLLDLDTREDRLLAEAPFGDALGPESPVWSPDGRWIAINTLGEKSFTNVHVVASAGGPARQVSFLANAFSGRPSWAPDGAYVLFDTRQRTEEGRVARVDLTLRVPRFRESQFRDLFAPEPSKPGSAPGAPPSGPAAARPGPTSQPRQPDRTAGSPAPAGSETSPIEIAFEGIRQRLSLVPVGVDVGSLAISPDGKWLVMIAGAEGQANVYAYSLDPLAKERPVARQLTSTSAPKSSIQITPDSKEVFYLQGGRIRVVPLERGEGRALDVTASFDVDFSRERLEVFQEAWRLQRDNFFDPQFHGVDWSALRERFAPYAAGAGTPDELRRVVSLMIGELNASHLGISAPSSADPVTGRLGLRFDRDEFERDGRLRVTEVISLGPAAVTNRIAPGNYLLAVQDVPITPRTNLDALLEHTVDTRVVLTVADAADGKTPREVPVKPVSRAAEKALLYRHWVEANRAYVGTISGGRLGYVHMLSMSAEALEQLYLDLDAENYGREGVVVDLRNNNGGFVNVYALDVLARRGYLNMTLRGLPTWPARSVLGQRALQAPTVLVVNQHSLSDAEDFTEGYRALKLGAVVGEPTAGWIIYTWNTTLLDGSTFRLPRMRITDGEGRDMEMHPRPVDVPVTRPVGESLTGRDSQLDAAVKALLAQIGAR